MLNLVPSAFMASFPCHRVRLAWPFAVIVALMLVLCNASLDVMSGMRALSTAEGARSKALAYAVRALEQYAQMRDDDAYERFLADMAAATALRDARVAL